MDADLYVPVDGWLHKADPRAKFLISLLLLGLSLALRRIDVILLVLIIEHVLLLTSKIPVSKVLWVWKILLLLIVMIIAMWPFFDHSGNDVLVRFGPLVLTVQNLTMATIMGLRIPALGFACFVLFFTTNQAILVRGLVALGVPYRVGLTISTSFRYIPEFFNIFSTIAQAQQARGLNLKAKSVSLAQRFYAYIPIIIAVLIQGFKMSENIGKAMESRGLGITKIRRTYFRQLVFRPTDLMICLISIVIGVIIIAVAVIF